jgi:DNA modification methylase
MGVSNSEHRGDTGEARIGTDHFRNSSRYVDQPAEKLYLGSDGKLGKNCTSWQGAGRHATVKSGGGVFCKKCGARRIDAQLGLEPTPEEHVENMVRVFREVRRVLRSDGSCWMNYGDVYASWHKKYEMVTGVKSKDLVGVPWMLARALQADGWYLRSCIIWFKVNPMPESCTDRPTKSYEYIFLLTKEPRYFYDAEAVREKGTGRAPGNKRYKYDGLPGHETKQNLTADVVHDTHNLRDVWIIPTAPYADAHFACVDAETECLTSKGWRLHNKLKPGDTAAQYDLETQKLSWGTVEDVARYRVSEQEMIVSTNRDLRVKLTPNHRCVIQRRRGRTREMMPPVVVRADELKQSHRVPTAAEWDFDGDMSLPLEWAELLGWYIAEGHACKCSPSVEIYQSESANPKHCRRIERLLRQTGAEWTMAQMSREYRGRTTLQNVYKVMGYAAARLRELAPKKHVPAASLMWSRDRAMALLRGLVHGDGSIREDGRACFIQKSKRDVGLVQALALRCGLSACVSKRYGCKTWVCYLTRSRYRSFRGTNGAGTGPMRQLYTGVVWCPKLPLGTWVARRQGRVFITGNTYPPELVRRCVKAGTSEKGCCKKCGAPWVRIVERTGGSVGEAWHDHTDDAGTGNNKTGSSAGYQRRTKGWEPGCGCGADVIPCTVLDPFGGAGTTALAASGDLERHTTLIELNEKYARMAKRRIVKAGTLWMDVKLLRKKGKKKRGRPTLKVPPEDV